MGYVLNNIKYPRSSVPLSNLLIKSVFQSQGLSILEYNLNIIKQQGRRHKFKQHLKNNIIHKISEKFSL